MVFRETQGFAPWVLWLMRAVLIIYILGFFAVIMVVGFHPAWLLWFLGVPALLILEFSKLESVVNSDGIRINFIPFTKRTFAWTDIEQADVIDYGFIGGWGIRLGTRYGTAYNTQGRIGLALKLANGKRVLIGTQRKSAMEQAVKRYFQL